MPVLEEQTRRAVEALPTQSKTFQCVFNPDQKSAQMQALRYQKWVLTCQKILSTGETYKGVNIANGIPSNKPISLNGLKQCLH